MEFSTTGVSFPVVEAEDIWERANVTRPLPPYWERSTRVCLATLLASFMLLAIVGNSMVIIVIARHRGMRTRTNLFLCSLALADLLCGTLDMPFSLVTMIKGDWWFGQTACQFNGFAMPFFFVASIHTLMYISIHKYISIKAPFTKILTRHRVWLMILAAWLWAAVAGYITIHGLNRVEYKANTAQCGPTYPNDTKTYTHLLLLAITCYFIPLFVMAFCYIDMFREIRAHSRRLKTNTTIDRDLVFIQQKRVTVTLFLVLVAFVVCWTPFIAYLTYTSVLDDKTIIPAWINPAAYWFGYMNSACNPIIYALRSPAFRDGYRQLLCRPRSYLSTEAGDADRHTIWDQHYMEYSISRKFTRFQNFLRETLPKSLHGSGSPIGGPSETPSRKNSLTSLTHYLLFPKSRSLSTSSLPNLRTNAVMRPIRDIDLTKATFIGGIPVLTKCGKVVCYQDPTRDNRRRPQSNVYYPDPSRAQVDKTSKKSSKAKHQEVEPPLDSGETSGLLSSELETSENWQGSQDSSIFKKPVQIEPDIVIHVQDVEACVELEPRGNRVSSESGFEEGEEPVFVPVADTSSKSSEPKPEYVELCPVSSIKRNSAPTLDASPFKKRDPSEESRYDLMRRSFSDSPEHRIELAVSPVSKSPSDSCIGQVSQPNVTKSSSDPNLKKPQHKSIRRQILKRLFSKTKGRGKSAMLPGLDEERNRSSSVSPPQQPKRSLKTFDYLSPIESVDEFRGRARTCAATFAKAASDTCLDRPELSNTDHATSFKVKDKRKKSKSERVKQKKHANGSEQVVSKKDLLFSDDPLGTRKSYSVKVRVRRLPSVERLDITGDEPTKLDGQPKRRHRKKAKHPTEEVVLEMETLPRGQSLEEYNLDDGGLVAKKALTKAIAVTGDLGTRVSFYVPEPDDAHFPPPALFRCASDPCLTFKRIEEKAMKRRETKKRKKHYRQSRVRKHPGVSIRVVDEDPVPNTEGVDFPDSKHSKHGKTRKGIPKNNLLLTVHQPLFRTKSDPAPKSPDSVKDSEVSPPLPPPPPPPEGEAASGVALTSETACASDPTEENVCATLLHPAEAPTAELSKAKSHSSAVSPADIDLGVPSTETNGSSRQTVSEALEDT